MHASAANRSRRLQGVVVAFDLDNTLFDPTGRAYQDTIEQFRSRVDLGLGPEEALSVFAELRHVGNAMERLGLQNPLHERGNADALAYLCLTRDLPADVQRPNTVRGANAACRKLVFQLADLDAAARQGPPGTRLEAELAARRCAADPRAAQFREQITALAGGPAIAAWAAAYRAIELAQPVDDFRPLFDALSDLGAATVVISEGRTAIQKEKVRRLGLSDLLDGRILVTDAAADLPGSSGFDRRLDELIDLQLRNPHSPMDPDLAWLWYFRCVVDSWRSKTPWFYARCLHALYRNPERPEDGLAQLAVVPAEVWARGAMRFVMVGDRYDMDVLPLIELLGPACGLRIRLKQGKYSHLHSDDELAVHLRPDRTFLEWESLGQFLTTGLTTDSIGPITSPPAMIPDKAPPDYVPRGLDSPCTLVRAVSEVIRDARG